MSIRRGTSDNYTYIYKTHIESYFGSWRLSDIKPDDIRIFRKHLEAKGLQANTINTYLKPLCQCLLVAHKRGLIKSYPCEGVESLKESKPDIDPFSFDELKHWLDYLKEKNLEWHDLIFFWSRTGLRPGELFALKWERVDFYNRKILIRENRPYYGGSAEPKTQSSIRDIDIRQASIEILQRQFERTGLQNKWVFLNQQNRQWTATDFRAKFKHWCKMAGLKPRNPKEMRHTFATLHIAAGESITWVARMLGHSNAQVTWTRYNRFIPNLTREDGSAFEKLMEDKNSNIQVTTKTHY